MALLLQHVKDDDDPAVLHGNSIELCQFVLHLPMGRFLSSRIASMLSFDRENTLLILGAPPDPKTAERRHREARDYN